MITGTILHYKILEKLGEGGMGVVYKAYDTKLNRTVALKFLPSQLIRDNETRKRFIHEARAASALDHPNIGTIFEINENIETPFISMAYYDGKTLKEKIAEGKIDIEKAVRIAIKIASGLKKANSKDIIHRDIKPANIIFTDDGEIKIIDFGLAKLMINTALTQTGTVMGTLGYMSPELLQGLKVDHRTDIWSLGVVLYEMLTGKCPFQAEFDQAILYNIINEEPEFITKVNNDITLQIEKIINKALSKDPEKRFNSMDEMEEALKLALDEYRSGENTSSFIHKLGRKQLKIMKRLSFIFLFLAAIIIYWWFNSNATSQPVSIAILPMENISNNSDQEWLADGMTDALITDLAKIGGLRVISRTSVMHYKGTEKPMPAIARELGVEYLVESSVSKIGNQVKISARLVDTPGDQYVWANDYERAFSNVLSLQGEIAQTIANQVQVKLTPQEQTLLIGTRQVNPETYEAYLKGMFYLNKFTPEGIERGLAYLHEAIEKDPTDPLAYAGLALGYSLVASHSPKPPPDAFAKAKAAALKALKLDENVAAAHGAVAEIKLYREWDWAGAEQSFRRALELNPSLAQAHAHYAWYLSLFRRQDEAVAEMERAIQVDPLTPLWNAWLGSIYYWTAGKYDKAIDEARKTLELDPDFPWAYLVLGNGYAGKGMYEEAIAAHQKAVSINPGWGWARACLARSYAFAGQTSKARKIATELEAQNQPINNVGLTAIYTAMGEKDTAFKWMDAAYKHRHPWTPWFNSVLFESLHDDPRYKEIIKKMGLPL